MEFQLSKNARIIVDLAIGEEIIIKDWGCNLDGKHFVQGIKQNFGGCQTGIMVKISGYDHWIDSNWITKIHQPTEPKTEEK